ncbi:MAG TPA: outer membrane protein [Pseudolabrys sp.]|nr:outer membrane protein [Pseudolabrys sp.]
MKKTLVAAAFAAGLVGAAAAADLPRSPAPYYAPAQSGLYNWSGAYAGLNLGYQWGTITNSNVSPSGIAGGGQVGYNWQNGQFVFGVETDFQFTGSDDTFAPFKFSNPWFGTLRGRAGAAFNNVLLYATLGLAYGSLEGQIPGLDETRTEVGWAGGIGAEYGFNPNWSARVEYLYMDLASRGFSITGTDNGFHANMLRFGVNYHF